MIRSGIGRSIETIDQINALQRPLSMEEGGVVLMDLLWSDPTTNDAVEGVQPSPRGPGLVTFGPDRVREFCKVKQLSGMLVPDGKKGKQRSIEPFSLYKPTTQTFWIDSQSCVLQNNELRMIIRAHECVMDGFERFAQGHLITIFSATNYCGSANNAGAILVLGRNLVLVPKLIHPLPPATPRSPDSGGVEDENAGGTWMQVSGKDCADPLAFVIYL